MSRKIAEFLANTQRQTPFLVIDLDLVVERFWATRKALPNMDIYYAVKANPAAEIVQALAKEGSLFDVASVPEIDICRRTGVSPTQISYGQTIKKETDIATAHAAGVDLFAFDSKGEMEKLSRSAPESKVFCRIATKGHGAEWPLSKKFGCQTDVAEELMKQAKNYGLKPHGLSFHVGSQQTDPEQWDGAIADASKIFYNLAKAGIELELVNLGGGLPAKYHSNVPTLSHYGEKIVSSMCQHFGKQMPTMIFEPGRGLVGDAGVIQTEVILIADRNNSNPQRWVYLDIGKFGGLPETIGEAIKYRVRTPHDGSETVPCILAGPTCDEVDVLYKHTPYMLPKKLQIGDRIEIQSAGAYTWSYSSVCFNGIPPLRQYVI